MKNKLLIIVLLIVLVLSACSPEAKLEEREYEQDKTLSGELLIAINSVIDSEIEQLELSSRKGPPLYERMKAFVAEHPDVTIRVMRTVWTTWIDGKFLEFRSPDFSTMPDIIELTPNQVRFAVSDELYELSHFIENMPYEQQWHDDYASLIDKSSIDGGRYLLPVGSDPILVYYAEPIFEQLDIAPPAADWTWDDFIQTTQLLHTFGHFTALYKSIENIEHIIEALGGSYASPDYERFEGYFDSELTEQAFDVFFDYYDPHFEHFGSGTRTVLSLDTANTWPALGMARASELFVLLAAEERGYRFVNMPLSQEGEHHNTAIVTGLAMTQAAHDKSLAWEFMRYIVGEGDEQAMQFVADHAFFSHMSGAIYPKFYEQHPPNYNKLVDQVIYETAHADISSLAMYPNSLSGSYQRYGLYIDRDPELSVTEYLQQTTRFLEDLRDKVIERGLDGDDG